MNPWPGLPVRRYTVLTGTNTPREWLAACWWLLVGGGPTAVRRFEAAAARRTGCRSAFTFGAGRMGLYVLLEAIGLQPGDEVILPAFTCAAVPNALVYRGLKPVWVDIDPVTFNIDAARVEPAITSRTGAIYAQHTFGVSCDIARLREIADRHGLLLIEDASHSLGARLGEAPHGSLGDVAYFSTDRTKVINTHLGGCVTTSDLELARRLGVLQGQCRALGPGISRRVTFSFLAEYFLRAPWVLWIGRPALGALRRAGLTFTWTDEQMDTLPPRYPYPCRLPAAQARLGASQLAALSENLAHRRAIAEWLEERIGWYADALPGPFEDQAWLRYSFLVRDREGFIRRFGRRIDLGIWFPNIIFGREERTYASVGYEAGSCPVAEAVAGRIVNVPTHRRIPPALIRSLWSRHGDWVLSQLDRVSR